MQRLQRPRRATAEARNKCSAHTHTNTLAHRERAHTCTLHVRRELPLPQWRNGSVAQVGRNASHCNANGFHLSH